MEYEIETKNNLSGASLTVRFPEADLDQKALYTLYDNMPEFLLPFSHRVIDGMIECTYQIGNRVKLQYKFGERNPEEYVQFWKSVLTPLLDCEDWFLKPYSFFLNSGYLYIDKEKNICYLYIPSKEDCSGPHDLQKLAEELSEKNRVSNSEMENRVLRSIMKGFQPREFLALLQENVPKKAPVVAKITEKPHADPIASSSEGGINMAVPERMQQPPKSEMPAEQHGADDIVIHFAGDEKPQKKKKEKGSGLFITRPNAEKKKDKEVKPKKKGGLFGKRTEAENAQIVAGAAAQPSAPRYEPKSAPDLIYQSENTDDGVTLIDEFSKGGTHLRLIGDPSLPREILVEILPGQSFTIGRFDVNVGHQQSCFEFGKNTKAVSRQHAVIERMADGSYNMVDLLSAAGTFVDGNRLTPNVPVSLRNGCKVSFGTAGADYIWEE